MRDNDSRGIVRTVLSHNQSYLPHCPVLLALALSWAWAGLVACSAALADSGIYKWQDAEGRWHYTDQPARPPGVVARQVELPPISVYQALAEAGVQIDNDRVIQTLHGRVTRVIDGDTLAVATGQGQVKRVRLGELDAPERHQPYGKQATRALRRLVAKRQVRVAVTARDRYGRLVGRVHVAGRDVNARMIRDGHAWVYTQYASDPELPRLERQARAFGRGLWQAQQPTAPWQWRHARH